MNPSVEERGHGLLRQAAGLPRGRHPMCSSLIVVRRSRHEIVPNDDRVQRRSGPSHAADTRVTGISPELQRVETGTAGAFTAPSQDPV